MAASTTLVSTSLEIEGADPGGTSSNTLVVGSKTVVYGEFYPTRPVKGVAPAVSVFYSSRATRVPPPVGAEKAAEAYHPLPALCYWPPPVRVSVPQARAYVNRASKPAYS